jgi:hypothetical protein
MVAHKLKVDGMDLAHAQIYLDDKPIRARAVKIDMGVDRIHAATIKMETLSVPDVDIEAFITFEFTPETVDQAIGVINSALKNGDYPEQAEILKKLTSVIEKYD